MARHAIDAAVISLSPPGVCFGDQGLADELARLVNEQHRGARRAAPPTASPGSRCCRCRTSTARSPSWPTRSTTLGLDGVMLLSNVAGTYLGDPALGPAVRRARPPRRVRLPAPDRRPRSRPPLPEHPIWLYEFPFDTTRAVANLVYSGTLERCPRHPPAGVPPRRRRRRSWPTASHRSRRASPSGAARGARRRPRPSSAGSGTTPACRTTSSRAGRRSSWRPPSGSSSGPTGRTPPCRPRATRRPGSTGSGPDRARASTPRTPPCSSRGWPRRSTWPPPSGDR